MRYVCFEANEVLELLVQKQMSDRSDSEDGQIYADDPLPQQKKWTEDEEDQKRRIRKIESIPSFWVVRCPLDKIAHNLKIIQAFQRKQIFPKVEFKSQPLDESRYKEKELFHNRSESAKYFCFFEGTRCNFNHNQPKTLYQMANIQMPRTYKTTMSTVINRTCYNIQDFIRKTLGLKITKLVRTQYQQIFATIFSCSEHYSMDFCETLFNFIMLTFNIPGFKFKGVYEVVKMYKTLQLAVKLKLLKRLEMISDNGRKLTSFRQLTVKTQLKNLWTPEFEKTFLHLYKQNTSFKWIRLTLKQHYPSVAQYINTNQLQKRFQMIMRLSMKLVRQSTIKYSGQQMPKLYPLYQQRFKRLSRGKDAVNIRLWLLDIYMAGQIQYQETFGIATVMNDYIENWEKNGASMSDIASSVGTSQYSTTSYFYDYQADSDKKDDNKSLKSTNLTLSHLNTHQNSYSIYQEPPSLNSPDSE